MSVVFFCTSCGSRFEVDAKLAGKKARCKKCGARTQIPGAAAAGAAAGAGMKLTPPPGLESAPAAHVAARPVSRPTNWMEAVTSQVALQAVSEHAVRAVMRPSALDDASSDSLYKVAAVPSLDVAAAAGPGPRSRPAGALTRGYRKEVGGLAKLLRTLNETAYLISVPFLVLLIFGVIVHNRPLALLGATLVVLLNVSRLVTGLFNLLAVPFRESPIQGLLFLIPPITVFYSWKNWNKVHKPMKRIIEPALTIFAVVLAFAFVPWLSQGETGTVTQRLEAGARELESGIRTKVESVPLDASGITRKASGLIQQGTGAIKSRVGSAAGDEPATASDPEK